MKDKIAGVADDYFEILGADTEKVEKSLQNPALGDIVKAIWKRDCSVWKGEVDAIRNRLGWLSLPENTTRSVEEIERFARSCRRAGIRRFVLTGMGGSVLASKVFAKTFAPADEVCVTVVDTTVGDTIAAVVSGIDFNETFFIVSSKSGRTIETVSVADFFFERCSQSLGAAKAAGKFAVITDPGTPMFESAKSKGFAAVFAGDKTVGGRFSPLSVFGMVPAAVIGADTGKILRSARDMAQRSRGTKTSGADCNTALRLAIAIDIFCKKGNGAFHIICSEAIAGFERFAEQMIGESLGKEGRRVLPVAHDLPASRKVSGAVFICLKNDTVMIDRARNAAETGIPIVIITLENEYGIGGEFFRLEMAVAILGALWNINPFDQPDVENTKSQTQNLIKIYEKKKKLSFSVPDFKHGNIEFRMSDPVTGSGRLLPYLEKCAMERKEKGYFCIQAFLDGSDRKLRNAVELFRYGLSETLGITTTADFSPAHLHSSGQLHKGGSDGGLFIQLLGKSGRDMEIPSQPQGNGRLSFEILKDAQALGDMKALESKGRKVVQIRFLSDACDGILSVSELLGITKTA